MQLKDIIKKWEQILPLSYQEKWDHCGLNLGNPSQNITRVLFAYDICHEVVRFAVQNKCQLIISHHPFRMRGDINIRTDSYDGQTIELCLKNNIALYSCHTNHDASALSLNRHYLNKLGLHNIQPLVPPPQKLIKLVTFVPQTQAKPVMQALFDAGAGNIGNYDECSFSTPGTGTFRGNEKTNPAIGKRHHREHVAEDRVETIVPQDLLGQVLTALKTTHPYEEVAYDLYPLENQRQDIGLGAIGEYKEPLGKRELLTKIKSLFKAPVLKWVGSQQKKFSRVAICTGSGTSLMDAALRKQADMFITGDIKYHQAIEAKRQDLALVDVGHFYSEIDSVNVLKTIFDTNFKNLSPSLEYKKLKDAFEFF